MSAKWSQGGAGEMTRASGGGSLSSALSVVTCECLVGGGEGGGVRGSEGAVRAALRPVASVARPGLVSTPAHRRPGHSYTTTT